MREAYPQIVDNYIRTGKIKYFYRALPLPMPAPATLAAEAALCTGDHGKFWEMRDSLFANQGALTGTDTSSRAKSVGTDRDQLTQCLSNQKHSNEIRKSTTEAQSMGMDGTPNLFLGFIEEKGDVVNFEKRS